MDIDPNNNYLEVFHMAATDIFSNPLHQGPRVKLMNAVSNLPSKFSACSTWFPMFLLTKQGSPAIVVLVDIAPTHKRVNLVILQTVS